MIRNLCLICHDASKNNAITDIHDVENAFFKASLENILKRRILSDKFEENQICTACHSLITEHQTLEARLIEICDHLSEKFKIIHPSKRGRKPKTESETVENVSASSENKNNDEIQCEPRKSQRKRKLKDFDSVFMDPEKSFNDGDDPFGSDTSVPKKSFRSKEPKILSSMATNCPHCDFAADSDVQVKTIFYSCFKGDNVNF